MRRSFSAELLARLRELPSEHVLAHLAIGLKAGSDIRAGQNTPAAAAGSAYGTGRLRDSDHRAQVVRHAGRARAVAAPSTWRCMCSGCRSWMPSSISPSQAGVAWSRSSVRGRCHPPAEVPEALAMRPRLRPRRSVCVSQGRSGFPLLFTAELELIEPAVAFSARTCRAARPYRRYAAHLCRDSVRLVRDTRTEPASSGVTRTRPISSPTATGCCWSQAHTRGGPTASARSTTVSAACCASMSGRCARVGCSARRLIGRGERFRGHPSASGGAGHHP